MSALILVFIALTTSQRVNSQNTRVSTLFVAFNTYLITLGMFQGLQLICGYRVQFLGYYTPEIIHIIWIISILVGLIIAIYFIFKNIDMRKQYIEFIFSVFIALMYTVIVLLALTKDTDDLQLVPRYNQFYYGGATQVQIDKHGTDSLLTEISFYNKDGDLVGYQYSLDDSLSSPIVSIAKYEENTLYIGNFEMIEFNLEQTDKPFVHYNQENLGENDILDYTTIEFGKKYQFVDL